MTVTAVQNATRDIQLDTSVSAPVSTFFMRLFGISSIQATRKSAAEYVVPVPMGSPLNYFGAFGDLRGLIHMDPGFRDATAIKGPATTWTNVTEAFVKRRRVRNDDHDRRRSSSAHSTSRCTGPPSSSRTDGGIEVTVTGHASSAAGCKIKVDVSPDNGVNWYGGPPERAAICERRERSRRAPPRPSA